MNVSLSQQVASRIRDMIVLDELRPGARLRERQLAEELKVSRTPLREALKILSTEGLVVLSPNRGAEVSGFSAVDIGEKLQVLAALERLAGELACKQASDEAIAEIRALHFEMLAAYSRQDRKAYFRANQKIHRGLVRASNNNALIETHDRLNTQLYRVRYLSNLRNARWSTAIDEHQAILEALEARDAAKLGRLMFEHLGSTWFNFSEIKDDPRLVPPQAVRGSDREESTARPGQIDPS